MRKALVAGIDYYSGISPLLGCVNDAHAVKAILERNADGTVNFSVKLLVGTGPSDAVARTDLKESVRNLFADDSEIAVFYFAGHGYIETTGGYLCASDSKTGDDGLSLDEVLTFANKSKAKNKIIMLDSCHSGIAGEHPRSGTSELTEGMTILTASTKEQYASEKNGSGVFTKLLVNALGGAAQNLLGDITPGSVYAHIDQSLGPWDQRPLFKTNVKSFVSLRKVQPPIALSELHRITEFFPTPGHVFRLDPTFEPVRAGNEQNMPPPDPKHTEIFKILQKYNRVNLLIPVEAENMWNAAVESKGCKLTVLGEHYHRLVSQKLI